MPSAGSGASLSSFATTSSGAYGYGSASVHGSLSSAAITQLAAHGWTFAPSSGIRPVSQPTAGRQVVHPASRVPVVVPPAGSPFRPRPRPPYATTIIRPGFGFIGGGGCINNGFTIVCGIGGFFNPFWGYGYGLGYGGYGYYSPGDYYVGGGESYLSTADDLYPQNSGRMDIYGGYSADALTPPEGETAVPAAPPTQIILKSGQAFAVRDYWTSNGELYYRPVTGGLSHVPLDQLDLSSTVQANSRNGIAFTLKERTE